MPKPAKTTLEEENAALRQRVTELEVQLSQRTGSGETVSNDGHFYRLLFENSGSMILAVDADSSQIVDANPAACAFYGYSHAKLTQLRMPDLAEAAPEVTLGLVEKIANGEITHLQNRHRLANGEVRDVEAFLGRQVYRGRKINIAVVEDVTAHRQAEQALRESEERYRGFVSQAYDAFTLTDEHGVVIEWNQATEKLTGIPAREALGQFAWDMQLRVNSPEKVTADLRDQTRQRIEAVLKTGDGPIISTYETRIKRPDGQEIITGQKLFTIKTARGFQLGSITYDLTEERGAEEKLKASESRYRMLFENMGEGFALQEIIQDENGRVVDFRIIDANPAYEKHTGQKLEEIIGRTVREIMPNVDPVMIERYGEVALTGNPLSFEYYSKTFDRHLRVRAFRPLPNHFATIFEDVTERTQAEQALRESEARFSTIFYSSHDAISIARLEDDIYIDVNEAFCNAFGLAREEVIGHTGRELKFSADPKRREKLIELIHSQGIVNNFEAQYRRRNGQTGCMLISGRIVRILGQECVVIFGKDITEYKQAVEDLHQSETRFNRVFRSSPIGINVFELDTLRCREVNDAFLEIVGYSHEEVLGHTAVELNLLSQEESLPIWIQTLFSEGEVKNIESIIRRKSGENRHLTVNAQTFELRGERLAMLLVVDITERKNAELLLSAVNTELEKRVAERTAELTRNIERLDLATDAAQMGIWDWDIQQNKLVWDKQMYALYGVKPENFSGAYDAWLGGIHPDDREVSDREAEQTLNGERPYHTEFRVLWPDGSVHWLKADGRVFWDKQGKPLRMLGVDYDITERKQAEAKLTETNAALKKALRAKDEFLAAVTHELRTPLNGILGMAEALQMPTYGSLTARQLKAVYIIETSGGRLLDLVTDVLDYSQMQSGKILLASEVCSFDEVCRTVLKTIQPNSVQKNQKISCKVDPGLATLRTDAPLLRKALLHLLRNASKFTAQGGEFGITVSGSRDTHSVTFTVWDTGIGIQAENLPRLFKPFVQLDAGLARQYEGAGLGLALVKQIAELLGGEVDVTSVFGEGSRFTLTLPWKE